MECTLRSIATFDCDGPFVLRVRITVCCDGSREPHVQLHQASICLEPVSKLVLGGKSGPVGWKGKI